MTSVATSTLPWTGERMIPGLTAASTFWEHILRYRFAAQFVKGKRVADVACGEGYGTAALLAAGARTVVGVDISPETCEHARRKYGVDARSGSATNLPLESGSIDLFVSFETIEHIDNPVDFVSEIRRVLSHGGTAIISTPNQVKYSELTPENPFHVSEMTIQEFCDLLAGSFDQTILFGQNAQPLRNGRPSHQGMLTTLIQRGAHLPGLWRLYRHLSRLEQWWSYQRWTDRSSITRLVSRPSRAIPHVSRDYDVRPAAEVNLDCCEYIVAVCTTGTSDTLNTASS